MAGTTIEEFFAGHEDSRILFEELRAVIAALGSVELRVSKSQVAFRRHKNFALAWMPRTYLGRQSAPLVLSLSFSERDRSPRWKEIANPSPGRFTHHLELHCPDDIDDQVRGWLTRAWEEAG